jgi:hypothetical protein
LLDSEEEDGSVNKAASAKLNAAMGGIDTELSNVKND